MGSGSAGGVNAGGEDEGIGEAGVNGGASLVGELVEEGVFAFVGGPDGQVVVPGNAGLGGLPEEFSVWVFGKFVEADVAAVNGHGIGVGGEGDDAGAVIEFDVADLDFFGEGGGPAGGVEGFDFEEVFAVGEDGTGEAEDAGEFINPAHVFEGGGPVFSDEEIVTARVAEAFADVFEAVGEGPADADGFFGEGKDTEAAGVVGLFRFDPGDLVWGKELGQE